MAFSGASDVFAYSAVRIHFWFMSMGFGSGPSFYLDYSEDDGVTWSAANSWLTGGGFSNDEATWNEVTEDIDVSKMSRLRLRFRYDGDDEEDRIWIDDVEVSAR